MGEDLRIIWLLGIGLGLACLFGYLALRSKQSPIIGYLLAGYIIGPNFPGFVADPYIADQLASIGITLLMFAVGLSFNWKDLMAVKKIAVPGAITLSILSILAGTLYSVYLGETWIAGVVIGLAICVSSTVVIVRVLSDQKLLHTREGHLVVGWTIVEDLISIFGLLLLPSLVPSLIAENSHPWGVLYQIIWVLGKIALLGLFIWSFGERGIEAILKVVSRTRSHELFTLTILAITFLIAMGSSYFFGVSLALGAFIAGTMIGKTEMSHQAAASALPMRDAFAVIFFLSVGMLFNPIALMKDLPLFFGILAILLLLRPLVAFLIVKGSGYNAIVAATVALAISQIGEYSFILAEEGSRLGVVPDNVFDVIVASAFVTIALNPLIFQCFGSFFKQERHLKEPLPKEGPASDLFDQEQTSFLPKAVVVGFGPVGQLAAEHLVKRGYHVLIIDRNIDTISSLKEEEMDTLFGDASQFHILEQAQIQNVQLLVITTPEFAISKSIIQTARLINPSIKIVARSHFQEELKHSAIQDVATVCDEEASREKFISVINQQLST